MSTEFWIAFGFLIMAFLLVYVIVEIGYRIIEYYDKKQ
jgi:hypothetical protein